MKKVPKKIYLQQDLINVLDAIAVHYEISKTTLIEDMLLAYLFPEEKPIRILLIENDDDFKKIVSKSSFL